MKRLPIFAWLRKHGYRTKLSLWLGEEGIRFFTKLYEKHGKLAVIIRDGAIPHPVHFREGMQVRNWMRKNTSIPEDRLDDEWEDFVIDNLGLRKETA